MTHAEQAVKQTNIRDIIVVFIERINSKHEPGPMKTQVCLHTEWSVKQIGKQVDKQ